MLRSVLKGFDKRRLRIALLAFFVALAVPTGVLVYQAWSQLKWEAFYQHRVLAAELTARIDARLSDLIAREEARSFGDYAFLVSSGGPAAMFLQPSPLSGYPVEAEMPGLIAWFQVDARGTLSTPLVPGAGVTASAYGIPAGELAERMALEREVSRILADNRLVERSPAERMASDYDGSTELALRKLSDMSSPAPFSLAPEMVLEESSMRAVAPKGITGSASDADRNLFAGEADDSFALQADEGFSAATAAPSSTSARSMSANQISELVSADVESQAAFDKLNTAPDSQEPELAPARETKLGRVDDLQLEDAYAGRRQELEQTAGDIARNEPVPKKRVRRKEQATLPVPAATGGFGGKPDLKSMRISTFESEIDPFEFSLLDSGHLVLFRNVWRDEQRYIQGVLIEQQPFFDTLFASAYRRTALSRMSNLIVAWRGQVLDSYTGAEVRPGYASSAAELTGALLYQARMSAPLADLEMIVSINQLPAGAGSGVILWVAVILGIVMCGGLLTMYRLGVGQIDLARQQQDFVSAVSHELKTPLTSIRMYGEMLQAGWADEDKKQAYYEFIHDESERLSRLIENVLQLAHMTRNDPQFDLQDITVGELMDMIDSKVGAQAERAGFSLPTEYAEALAATVVCVDADCFTQIIINLVDNAIKFSAKADNKVIDVGARRQPDGTVQFTVRDYGPGISRGQMKKIFQLFYRTGDELTRETVGTGIGLALVHQLVSAMNGKVDVVNREPGAEFRVNFPVT